MTTAHREALRLVKAWCQKQKIVLASNPRHIQPRAYVVGYAAPQCLIVAEPWMDAEPHMRDFTRANPLQTVRRFDKALKAGDWCITAYVTTISSGEVVAVAYPTERTR